jgi:hypothetical protein
MPTTTTLVRSLALVLDQALPGELADAMRSLKLGTLVTPLKRVFTGLVASATMDLTAIDGTGETAGVGNALRLAMLGFLYLRVDASGTAASLGNYIVGPPTSTLLIPPGGANVAVGVARLSDDGKTLTFPNTITGFTVAYIPRILSAAQLAAAFAPTP